MPVLASLPIALASCIAGIGAILVLRFSRPERKKIIGLVGATTAFQFVVTAVALSFLPWDDAPLYDEYRGPFFLIGSFVVFTLFHVVCLLSQIAKKEPNQPPEPMPLKRHGSS